MRDTVRYALPVRPAGRARPPRCSSAATWTGSSTSAATAVARADISVRRSSLGRESSTAGRRRAERADAAPAARPARRGRRGRRADRRGCCSRTPPPRSSSRTSQRWARRSPLAPATTTARCWTSACPTPTGFEGLERAARRRRRRCRSSCSPGMSDEGRGVEALAAGAQDYLVKGHVDGELLVAVGPLRRRAPPGRASPSASSRSPQLQAAENTRLERGLLPTPLVADSAPADRHPLPRRPPPGAAGRRLLRRRRGRRRLPARGHRRRLRPRARRGGASASACGSPGARSCWRARPTRPCCRCCRTCSRPSATTASVFTTLAAVDDRARPPRR